MSDVTSAGHRELAVTVRDLLAAYRDSADLIEVGAYQPGSNPRVDRALACMGALNTFLRQAPAEHFTLEQTIAAVRQAVTAPAPVPQGRRVGA